MGVFLTLCRVLFSPCAGFLFHPVQGSFLTLCRVPFPPCAGTLCRVLPVQGSFSTLCRIPFQGSFSTLCRDPFPPCAGWKRNPAQGGKGIRHRVKKESCAGWKRTLHRVEEEPCTGRTLHRVPAAQASRAETTRTAQGGKNNLQGRMQGTSLQGGNYQDCTGRKKNPAGQN